MTESWASSSAVRKSMQGNRSRDTRPELALRRACYAIGLRYRVCARPLAEMRRTADMVFRRARVAVFVDGCFWHGCPECYKPPGGPNAAYWAAKAARNVARDRDTDDALAKAGWLVVRFWEHEDPAEAAQMVKYLVVSRLHHGNRPRAAA